MTARPLHQADEDSLRAQALQPKKTMDEYEPGAVLQRLVGDRCHANSGPKSIALTTQEQIFRMQAVRNIRFRVDTAHGTTL